MTWEVRMSNSRAVPYFYNVATGASSWQSPAELTPEQIQQLPGADVYLGDASAASAAGPTGTQPTKVRASHLLVKHRESRRPSSWREKTITRSKEEAVALLKGYAGQIAGSAEMFKTLAKEHSDDSSHDRGGDLGWFGPGQMQKAFEEAAFSLNVGEISGVVSSDSGVHLIMRTG